MRFGSSGSPRWFEPASAGWLAVMTIAGRPAGWRLLGQAVRLAGRYLYLTLIAFGVTMSGAVDYQEILRELTTSRTGSGGGEPAAADVPEGAGRTAGADAAGTGTSQQPELPGHPERPAGHVPPTAEERALWAQLR